MYSKIVKNFQQFVKSLLTWFEFQSSAKYFLAVTLHPNRPQLWEDSDQPSLLTVVPLLETSIWAVVSNLFYNKALATIENS